MSGFGLARALATITVACTVTAGVCLVWYSWDVTVGWLAVSAGFAAFANAETARVRRSREEERRVRKARTRLLGAMSAHVLTLQRCGYSARRSADAMRTFGDALLLAETGMVDREGRLR